MRASGEFLVPGSSNSSSRQLSPRGTPNTSRGGSLANRPMTRTLRFDYSTSSRTASLEDSLQPTPRTSALLISIAPKDLTPEGLTISPLPETSPPPALSPLPGQYSPVPNDASPALIDADHPYVNTVAEPYAWPEPERATPTALLVAWGGYPNLTSSQATTARVVPPPVTFYHTSSNHHRSFPSTLLRSNPFRALTHTHSWSSKGVAALEIVSPGEAKTPKPLRALPSNNAQPRSRRFSPTNQVRPAPLLVDDAVTLLPRIGVRGGSPTKRNSVKTSSEPSPKNSPKVVTVSPPVEVGVESFVAKIGLRRASPPRVAPMLTRRPSPPREVTTLKLGSRGISPPPPLKSLENSLRQVVVRGKTSKVAILTTQIEFSSLLLTPHTSYSSRFLTLLPRNIFCADELGAVAAAVVDEYAPARRGAYVNPLPPVLHRGEGGGK
jgi:hypothetical protein